MGTSVRYLIFMQILLINITELWAEIALLKRKILAAIQSVVTRDIWTRYDWLINCNT
jgi:hypothetical protein